MATNKTDRAWNFGDIVRNTSAGSIMEGREGEIISIGSVNVKVRLFDSSHTPNWAWGTFELIRSAEDTRRTKEAMKEAELAKAREDELAAASYPHSNEAEYRFTGKVEHYNGHPSGVECQEIIRECKDPLVAFAMKHLWRTQWGNKPGAPKVLDLKKVIEYCELELAREAGQARL